jgi:uncharacterized protein with HEPN domain
MSNKQGRVVQRVQDIQLAIKNAVEDLGDLDKEAFLKDGKTQRAVIESLIVIGEAANQILRLDPTIAESSSLIGKHLKEVYDMRLVLTHQYFRVDAGVVWDTVKSDIPELKKLLNDFSNKDPA